MKSLQRFAASGLLGVLACFSTGQVFADAVITDAGRGVSVVIGASNDFSGDVLTSGTFNDSVSISNAGQDAAADQNSSIGVSQFGGTGHSEVDGSTAGGLGAAAGSSYFVEFTLAGSHAYSLSGELEGFLDGGASSAFVTLIGGLGTNIIFQAIGDTGPVIFGDAGVLGPGLYELTAIASSVGQDNTNYFVRTDWEFNLTLRQLPEPATLALLGIALAGLGFSRRKRMN